MASVVDTALNHHWLPLVLKVLLKVSSAQLTPCSRWNPYQKTSKMWLTSVVVTDVEAVTVWLTLLIHAEPGAEGRRTLLVVCAAGRNLHIVSLCNFHISLYRHHQYPPPPLLWDGMTHLSSLLVPLFTKWAFCEREHIYFFLVYVLLCGRLTNEWLW